MQKILFSLIFAFVLLYAKPTETYAQCAMCRAAPGSNLAAGGKDGAGLNKGIFYMFLGPYCIVGVMGYLWWRGRKQYINEEENTEIQRVLNEAGEEV
jgi:hypothetical protein